MEQTRTPGDPEPPLDIEALSRSLRGRIVTPLRLSLLKGGGPDDDALTHQLGRVASALLAAASELVTLDEDDVDLDGPRPALRLQRQGGGVIDYAALPDGPELEPFVDLAVGEPTAPLSATDRGALEILGEPARLTVFIAEACPHCPQAVRAAAALAQASPLVGCTVVDAQRHGALAERLGVRSVPMTFVDDSLSLVGVRPATELVAQLARRGGRGHAADLLRSMVEGGRVDEAADLLRGGGNEAFVDCWRGSTTSLRMGLLLAAEEALDEYLGCLDPAVDDLLALLESKDPALRGDTVDLLGRTAAPAAEAALRALAADADPDVAEAARDGLEAIAERREQEVAG